MGANAGEEREDVCYPEEHGEPPFLARANRGKRRGREQTPRPRREAFLTILQKSNARVPMNARVDTRSCSVEEEGQETPSLCRSDLCEERILLDTSSKHTTPILIVKRATSPGGHGESRSQECEARGQRGEKSTLPAPIHGQGEGQGQDQGEGGTTAESAAGPGREKPNTAEKKLPVLLVLHCTGSSSEELLQQGVLQRFARQGFMVVAVDSRYHGRRTESSSPTPTPTHTPTPTSPSTTPTAATSPPSPQKARQAYHAALIRSFDEAGQAGQEHPFIYDTVWDLMRVLDYLCARDDVLPDRIGCTGVSLGGMHSQFLAFADERVSAVAPAIGVQCFRHAVEQDCWHGRVESIPPLFTHAAQSLGKTRVDKQVVEEVWHAVAPGLLDTFSAAATLSAIAPRPLLVLNGAWDNRCPLQGVRTAMGEVQQEYALWGASSQLELLVDEAAGHEVTPRMWSAISTFFSKELLREAVSPTAEAEAGQEGGKERGQEGGEEEKDEEPPGGDTKGADGRGEGIAQHARLPLAMEA